MRLDILAAVLVILPNFSLVTAACSEEGGSCGLLGGGACCNGFKCDSRNIISGVT